MTKYIMILVFTLLTGTAFAQSGLLPALYDVTGVAGNDVLNMRQDAGASHPITATLAPNARGIEVVQLSKDGRWGLVGNGESSGWASMRYLARQSGQGGYDLPRPLSCFGTEPFWNLQLGQFGNDLDVLGEIQQTFATTWEGAPGNRGPYTYGVVLEEGSSNVHAVITRNLCDDGMSDRLYGFDVYAILSGGWGTRMVTGCCSLANN